MNIQFRIYSETSLDYELKENLYTNALIISIYKSPDEEVGDKYYALYHSNYKIIDPNNLNCSKEFKNEDIPDDEVNVCEEYIRESLGVFQITPPAKGHDSYYESFLKLKRIAMKTWSFEGISERIRKF